MRASRFVVLGLALASAGCMRLPPPRGAQAPPPAASASAAVPAASMAAANTPVPPPVATPQVVMGPADAAGAANAASAASAANAMAAEPIGAPAYLLDSGDKLRVVVFGQDGLSNSYAVDAAGNITMPL